MVRFWKREDEAWVILAIAYNHEVEKFHDLEEEMERGEAVLYKWKEQFDVMAEKLYLLGEKTLDLLANKDLRSFVDANEYH